MNKLNQSLEQDQNQEWKEKWVIEKTHKNLRKLLKITVSSYSQIQKLTSKMKEWDKITLQVKSWSAESFIKKLGDNGFDVKKWPKWQLTILKKEDILTAWAGFDEDMKKLDEKDKKELENNKKKLEKSKKELEKSKKELALANYGNNFAETLLDTLKWIQKNSLNKQDIIKNLEIIKKDTYAWNIVSSENNRQGRLESLNRIKILYKNNLKINSLINKIEKRLNSYDINQLKQ